MKYKLILIFLILVINSVGVISQSKQYFSVSVNAGMFNPFDLMTDRIKPGLSTGFDLESRNLNFGVYFSAKLNISKYVNTPENFNKDQTATIYEFNIGPRWYLGKINKIQGNIDLGFAAFAGNYVRGVKFGLTAAGGLNIPLNKKVVILAGTRFSLIGVDYFQPYITVYGGLRYNFNR